MSTLAAVLGAALLATTGGAPAADPPAPPRFFSPSSFWNTPVGGGQAVDPRSAALVDALAKEVASEERDRVGPWINTRSFSVPIYDVPADQPTVVVKLDSADPALASAFAEVPLPDDAQPAPGGDAHLVVSQPSTDRMWEFWRLQHEADGWHAAWGGAMQGVSTNAGVYNADAWPGAEAWWGATGTSLPLVGGLITLDDLRHGSIDHVIAFATPLTRAGEWASPAQRGDGVSTDLDSLPEGAHLVLDPSLDLASLHLPPLTLMIATAAQQYGMVVRDTSGNVTFYGQDPSPVSGVDPYTNNATGTGSEPGGYFDGEEPNQLLAQFPWASLEVLKMSLTCSVATLGAACGGTSGNASASGAPGSGAASSSSTDLPVTPEPNDGTGGLTAGSGSPPSAPRSQVHLATFALPLKLTAARLNVRKLVPAAHTLEVRYTLSRYAHVTIVVAGSMPSRRHRSITLATSGRRGENRSTFSAHGVRRRLGSGRFRVTITANDGSRASVSARLAFTIA